ncbi:G patch domain-containing protein 1-like [Poecilia formosa]|uniref:G patch domain-containing protein 1-like n=1 Tax=Poecilia formosa TaxID=48698 RepID=UPI0007B7AC97|nr:PREDICTED: G patch domain-containing protein 1-like [Poecilia formosa]
MAADSDSEEDFVSFGTPLEPLEEDEPLKKPVPLHEQTVKDERGRYQRFHGAFTGGFSAGYFNTVGSKEGWTPSTFVSSRQQKAEKHHARPEDFMDEERNKLRAPLVRRGSCSSGELEEFSWRNWFSFELQIS